MMRPQDMSIGEVKAADKNGVAEAADLVMGQFSKHDTYWRMQVVRNIATEVSKGIVKEAGKSTLARIARLLKMPEVSSLNDVIGRMKLNRESGDDKAIIAYKSAMRMNVTRLLRTYPWAKALDGLEKEMRGPRASSATGQDFNQRLLVVEKAISLMEERVNKLNLDVEACFDMISKETGPEIEPETGSEPEYVAETPATATEIKGRPTDGKDEAISDSHYSRINHLESTIRRLSSFLSDHQHMSNGKAVITIRDAL